MSEERKLIFILAKEETQNAAIALCTPENLIERQQEIYDKEGMTTKTLDVAGPTDMLPHLIMVAFMGVLIFVGNHISVLFETFWKYSFMVALSLSFICFALHLINNGVYGLRDKWIRHNVMKSFKKKSSLKYVAGQLFSEKAGRQEISPLLKKIIDAAEIFSEAELYHLKVKGDGKIRLADIEAITENDFKYQHFKQQVKKIA